MLGRTRLLKHDWSTYRREYFSSSDSLQFNSAFFLTLLAILIAVQLLCFMVYELIFLAEEYRMKIEYWNLGNKVIYESCHLYLIVK